jgi:hypothetical protein
MAGGEGGLSTKIHKAMECTVWEGSFTYCAPTVDLTMDVHYSVCAPGQASGRKLFRAEARTSKPIKPVETQCMECENDGALVE